MKIKYIQLDELHRGGVGLDGYLIIRIEELHKWWIFNWFKRCTRPILFELGLEDKEVGCTLHGKFLGRYMSLSINHRNIDTFDAKTEVFKLFNQHMEGKFFFRKKIVKYYDNGQFAWRLDKDRFGNDIIIDRRKFRKDGTGII